jgi:hypothetical protein
MIFSVTVFEGCFSTIQNCRQFSVSSEGIKRKLTLGVLIGFSEQLGYALMLAMPFLKLIFLFIFAMLNLSKNIRGLTASKPLILIRAGGSTLPIDIYRVCKGHFIGIE